jgi:hypothetical protein
LTNEKSQAKKQKTSDLRLIQNGAAGALGADQITVGHTAGEQENLLYDDDDVDEEDLNAPSTDEEENLTLQQQMWGRMAHNLEGLTTLMGQYFSHSTENTNSTNNLLRQIIPKSSSSNSRNSGGIGSFSRNYRSDSNSNSHSLLESNGDM